MDCTFLKRQGEPGQRTTLRTILTMVETITGMSNAVIVEYKGVTQYAPGEVEKFVDGEPAVKRFAETLITSLNGEVTSRLSPAYSHHSLGACEGWHTTLFIHLRRLRLQMSEQRGVPISEITTYHLRLHTQELGVKSTSEPPLHLKRQCDVNTPTITAP
eukprot:4373725-Amphidinium_carterae.3